MEKWLEIDLDKLAFNIQSLRQFFKVPIMAVIKQNAYGLGEVEIARFMEKEGIEFFAVTTIQEGINLRKGGVTSPILIFAPAFHEKEGIQDLVRYDLIPALYSLEAAETLNSYALSTGHVFDVHIKVDTGMGRMGFRPEELRAAVDRLLQSTGLKVKGLFTHYSNAFEPVMDYTKKQMEQLQSVATDMEKAGFPIEMKYSANSMAALKFPETHMDIVSIGSAFLGNSVLNPKVLLKKIYKCKVRVLQVKNLPKGSYVGYSNTFKTKKETRTAVIPIGYTDGFGLQKKIDAFRFNDYLREQIHLIKTFLKPKISVWYQGKPVRTIGKTSLQLTVVDVGSLPVQAGDIMEVEMNPLLANARLARSYVGAAADNVIDLNRYKMFEQGAYAFQEEVAATAVEEKKN